MRQQLPQGERVLAFRGELGPVFGDGAVEIQDAVLHQQRHYQVRRALVLMRIQRV